MAIPMTAGQLVSALRRWGLKVVEVDGWRTNNRDHVGVWGPVHGTMVHHTASFDGMGVVNVCFSGRSDLPGPLCTGVIRKDGTVYLVGNGRTNHAGNGSSAVYQAVVSETTIPSSPGPDVVDGNGKLYGWECVNLGDGLDPWPAVQLDAISRVQAAVCEFHNWSAESVIGHKEWTLRKIDPRGFAMLEMRDRIADHLKTGPTTAGEHMTLTSDEMDEVADRVVAKLKAGGGVLDPSDLKRIWSADAVAAAKPPYNNTDYFEADGVTPKNTTWTASYSQRTQTEGIREAVTLLHDIKATLGVMGAIGAGDLAEQVARELSRIVIGLNVVSN